MLVYFPAREKFTQFHFQLFYLQLPIWWIIAILFDWSRCEGVRCRNSKKLPVPVRFLLFFTFSFFLTILRFCFLPLQNYFIAANGFLYHLFLSFFTPTFSLCLSSFPETAVIIVCNWKIKNKGIQDSETALIRATDMAGEHRPARGQMTATQQTLAW